MRRTVCTDKPYKNRTYTKNMLGYYVREQVGLMTREKHSNLCVKLLHGHVLDVHQVDNDNSEMSEITHTRNNPSNVNTHNSIKIINRFFGGKLRITDFLNSAFRQTIQQYICVQPAIGFSRPPGELANGTWSTSGKAPLTPYTSFRDNFGVPGYLHTCIRIPLYVRNDNIRSRTTIVPFYSIIVR